MQTYTAITEGETLAAAAPPHSIGMHPQQEVTALGVADRFEAGLASVESRTFPFDGEVAVASTGVPAEKYRGSCSCARVSCALVSLLFTLFLVVDVYFACVDYVEYGRQLDPDDTNRRCALLWLRLFIPALLECVLMIAFFVRQLSTCEACFTPLSYGTAVDNADGGDETRSFDVADADATRRQKLLRCAVLLILSFFTAVVYLCAFGSPAYLLRHLVLHVKCIWITLLRSLVFSLYTFSIVLNE